MTHNPNFQWLVEGPPLQVLTRTAGPMIAAIFLLFAYDVLESQLLSTISLEALTALGFTVPVTTAMTAFAVAMTITTNTSVTRALGQGGQQAPQVILNALLMAIVLSLCFATLAYLANPWLFHLLGIDYALIPDNYHMGPKPDLLPLIENYMHWRYLGWVFMVLIWQANSLLRATGLNGHAGALFVCWMLSKITLLMVTFNLTTLADEAPLQSAAIVHLACDVSFAIVSVGLLFHKLALHRAFPVKFRLLDTFAKLSIVGLPATIQQLLTPLSITLLTVMVVPYGQLYVAVLGIVFRLEVLLLLLPMVLTTALPSIVGVNWWSGAKARVKQFLTLSKILIALFQSAIALVAFLLAKDISAWFSQGHQVQLSIEQYLLVVPISFIGAGITVICQSSFNASGHYIKASILSFTHRIVLKLSCCFIGLEIAGIEGLFFGLMTAHILSAILAVLLNRLIHKI